MNSPTSKILLVEDELKMVKMYRRILENFGYEVISALTSREAWETLEKNQPDLVLLDILLPGEDGISLLKRIRLTNEYKDLPVVILSNYDVPETREQVFSLGAKDYLMKANHTPQSLLEKVKIYLPIPEK